MKRPEGSIFDAKLDRTLTRSMYGGVTIVDVFPAGTDPEAVADEWQRRFPYGGYMTQVSHRTRPDGTLEVTCFHYTGCE